MSESPITERSITRAITEYLEKIEWSFTFKIHGSSCQRRGMPDMLFIHNGQAYFFEIKAAKGRVSRIQRHVIDKLRTSGAIVGVVRSVADVKQVLTL